MCAPHGTSIPGDGIERQCCMVLWYSRRDFMLLDCAQHNKKTGRGGTGFLPALATNMSGS